MPLRPSRPRRPGAALAAALLLALAPAGPRLGADTKPAAQPRLRPEGIDGALVLCGGQVPDDARARFVELAGGAKARLVLVTPSSSADDKLLAPWRALRPASAVVLRPRSRQEADAPKSLAALREATGVWFAGGDPARLAAAYAGTDFAKELHALLERGGAVGGTSAAAAALGRVLITGGDADAKAVGGLDLLPDAILDAEFAAADRRGRALGVLEKYPSFVGFGIADGTALVVRGRSLRVLGESTVSACLAPSKSRPARTIKLKPGAAADLTQLRRAARARAGAPFPPARAAVPEVAGGALVIVGGGMPPDVTRKFIELAGGPDALIVVLPTAGPDPLPARFGEAAMFQRAGARNVQVLRARALKDVEDPKNLDLLRKAGGVWFGGGRQWRFVDAYEGTKAEALFRDVLRRGGVIGGSSAGASIQAEYLVRGSPLGNLEMMCEGYERGLGFLPGVAVDQHFSQRKRFADMTALMKAYPQLLGIGIDEATAIVVRGHVAEVMGRNKVQFYDRKKPTAPGQPDYEVALPGGRYDLKARRALPAGAPVPAGRSGQAF
jgi:cyanophycinase